MALGIEEKVEFLVIFFKSPGVGREVKKVFIILSCQPWQWKPHCVQHKVMALPPHMAVEFSEE